MAEEGHTADCAILIPAFNEALGLADVVTVALEAKLGPVLVVDDGSTDNTSGVAEDAGAQVLRLTRNLGKGGAVAAGVRALDSRVVLLLDADLLGLTTGHLHDLARPVLASQVDMTRGVFKGGRWSTTAAQQMLPQLNGQRAIRRSLLLDLPDLERSRYGIEVVITDAARSGNWRVRDVPMPGVTQMTKEEKRGFIRGVGLRLKMYRDILRSLWQGGRRDD